MDQMTFAVQPTFEKYERVSRREQFLPEMETVVPWAELEALIKPPTMLRIYFLQHGFNLLDPGAENALYESPALRHFAGVDLGPMAAPDEKAILHFRYLLEIHDLCGAMPEVVSQGLERKGMRIATGTIVDATIIE